MKTEKHYTCTTYYIKAVQLICWIFATNEMTRGVESLHHHHEGHLKPFGSVGPYLPTDQMDGFPNTVGFFRHYVSRLKPLKMAGAAKLSRGFHQWTDAYLRSVDLNGQSSVSVESGKKENRSNPVVNMSFREFIERYNSTDNYMVDSVPDFISQDVLLPGPLQCQEIYEEMLVENIFWMSSGGTSSVVHTDSVDNIICLYRGEKQFIMIDPYVHRDNVDLDHPEGAYSGMDVDRVDYNKYPGLVSVSYHMVNLSSGDCLYIPFKWIHQVRSYGSNIAVNIWWSHKKNKQIDLDQCNGKLDLGLTLDKVTFYGFAPITDDVEVMKDHFMDFVRKETDIDQFISMFIHDPMLLSEHYSHTLPLKQIFLLIDKNRNRKISPEELHQLTDKEWEMIQRQMDRFDMMMEEDAALNSFDDFQHSLDDEL